MRNGCGMLTRRLLFCALFPCALSLPVAAGAQQIEESGRVGPARAVAYEIVPDDGLIERFTNHPRVGEWQITEVAADAAQLAPEWVRVALIDKLGRLPETNQEELAALLQAAFDEDPRYVDEVAFCIAHITEGDLTFVDTYTGTGFDPGLLLENVRLIYEAAPLFGHVELIESGDPAAGGDFHTTTRYHLIRDGEEATYELTRDEYYWWVVHPKISLDPVAYVYPPSDATLDKDDGGRFWREYLLAERGTPDDPTRPFVLRVPVEITDAELDGWSPSAMGHLVSTEIDPIQCIRRRSDGAPIMLRYTYRAPNEGGYNGTVLATTMPVEAAYVDGKSDLLINMVSLGDGNVRMRPIAGHEPVLVLKDRDPFGYPAVEEVLADEGYDFDVMDSTTFATIASSEDFEALGYEKVIVPSDQPRLFYQRLSDNRGVIDGWVGRSDRQDDMVFELHGAVDPAHLPQDDWTDLPMPGGLQGHDLSATTDEVEVWGYPRLLDVMDGSQLAWDGETHRALSGNRTLDSTATALDRIGYFVSQNLDDNVAELPEDWAGPDGDCQGMCVVRSLNAVRILYGHYENCGGIAILITAAARTALLPAAKVSGGPEDHEWNEIYLEDRWLPFQVDWSDSATRIDVPGNRQDVDYDGGKDLSMVFTFRGDGLAINDMERYSDNVFFSLTVTDATGNPVDGASVLLATETYYDEQQLMLATVEVTDTEGRVEFPVGDRQNYYIRVDSPAGYWPDADHVEWVACADENATNPGNIACPQKAPWDESRDMPTTDATGVTIPLDIVLDGQEGSGVPVLEPSGTVDGTDALSPYRLQVDLAVHHRVRDLVSLLTATDVDPMGRLDLFLLDSDNMMRYMQQQPFEAHQHVEILEEAEGPIVDLSLPDTSHSWYLLLSNSRRVATSQHYDIRIDVQSAQPDGGTDATDLTGGGGGGCGCRQGGAPASPAPWAFCLMGLCCLALARRLRRRKEERRTEHE